MLAGCVDWPDADAGRYRREGYWRGEVLGDLLRDWARAEPDRVALVHRDRRFSYAELDDRAERLAAGLHGLGLRAGDRVVLQLPNSAEFITTSVALFRLGVIPVLAVSQHRYNEIEYLCRHSEATALIIPDVCQGFDHRELAEQVCADVPGLRVLVQGDPGRFTALDDLDAEPLVLARPASSEVAFFLLSGGTTGRPKLIPRTHDDYSFQLRATVETLGLGSDLVYLAALPAAHNAALGVPGVLGTLKAGGRVVMADSPSPDEVFDLIAKERPVVTTLLPPLLALWIDMAPLFDADLSDMIIGMGGARLSPELAGRVHSELGARLQHWFGMAEGLLCYTRLDDPHEASTGTQGWPLCPADELCVVDPDTGQPVAPGEVGELQTRGPYTLRAYYRAEQANARSFTAEGFLRTGDLVRFTPEGRMVVAGRINEVINRGGEKVPCGELEELLLSHPAVREAAVAALPDAVLTEKIGAFVVADGVSGPELVDFLRGRGLAVFKLPDRVEFVDSLPRTAIGKVDKRALVAATVQQPAESAAG